MNTWQFNGCRPVVHKSNCAVCNACESCQKNVNVSVLITDIDVDNREAGDKITNLTTSALPVKPQLVQNFCSFLSSKPKMKVVPASTNVTPDIKPTTPELKNCRNRSLWHVISRGWIYCCYLLDVLRARLSTYILGPTGLLFLTINALCLVWTKLKILSVYW